MLNINKFTPPTIGFGEDDQITIYQIVATQKAVLDFRVKYRFCVVEN